MYLKLYQQETEKLAERYDKLLNELQIKLVQKEELSVIEEQAMLHALQVIIENAIGKARHLLKAEKTKVPISAYDLFEQMKNQGFLDEQTLNGMEKNYWSKKYHCA